MSPRVEQILKMLEAEPHDSFLNYALAMEHSSTGDVHMAVKLIEGVISRDPEYLGAYLTLGNLYERQGEPDKAKGAYQNGISIATKQNNRKALGELNEALQLLA